MKIKTSIVYIYFLVIVQTCFGIKKTTQRNYIERKKKKDPVDRNRATFPCFLPFLFLRVRENVTCAEGSFALLPPPHTQSSSVVVYPRWSKRGELRLYSAHSASSDSIRQSMMAEEERNRERERKRYEEWKYSWVFGSCPAIMRIRVRARTSRCTDDS